MGPLRASLRLKDAYAGAVCDGPLPLTTHADDFAGTLDYIWVSRAAEVSEVLEPPYEPSDAASFGKIPSEHFPSDHLAIGVRVRLPV